MDGHLGGFYLGATVNNASVKICVQLLPVKLPGSFGNSLVNFFGKCLP